MDVSFLSDLIITKIHSVSTIYTEESTAIKRWARNRWALLYKYEGETMYTCNGKNMLSNKSRVFLLPNGSDYTWQCIKAGHYCVIEFACEKTLNEILHFSVADSARLLETFKQLEYQHTLQNPFSEMECIQTLYGMLLKLLKSEKGYLPSEKQSKIQPAADYIIAHYTEPLTNDLLAKQTGLSTVYFRKLFTEQYGVSPMLYVQQMRIKKAQELLTTDHTSIESISQMLGYSSIYDFSRSFKKHTGLAPSVYAKQYIK